MNKTELVNAVADKSALSKKDAEKAVAAVFDTLTQTLSQGEKISLVGFGTFEVKECAEKTGRNPKTGEAIVIPAAKKPKFTAGKALKESVNK